MGAYEPLLEENNELRKALSSTKELVERYRSDNENLRRMHEDFKLHHERLKKECQESQAKCIEAVKSRRETESYYENYVQRLKNSIEQGKKEFDEMQAKMMPPVDNEILRLKLVEEIEGPMKIAIENKVEECSRLQDIVNDLKRNLELLQLQYGSYRSEAEKELRDMKDRHNSEVNQYFKEVQQLQERLEDASDKDIIRALKKERDEFKLRVEKLFEECDEIRKSRDAIKNEKNDLMIRYNHDVEEEKNKQRILNIDKDKFAIQNKDLQEQLYKLRLTHDAKLQEILTLKKDIETLTASLEASESQANYYKEEAAEYQHKLQEKDSQIEMRARELSKAEREKYQKEKEEKEKLQRKIDELAAKERELSSQLNSTESDLKYELDSVKQENRNIKDNMKLLESKLEAAKNESEMLRNSKELKEHDSDKVEEEFKILQEKYTELSRREKDAVLQKNALEEKLGRLEEDLRRGGNPQAFENLKSEFIKLEQKLNVAKAKVSEYKQKVRHGNEKLNELGLKLVQSEKERQNLLRQSK
ncbi:unnamed protein product [Blepharisma stoltei]|uniref:Uncharacterized protein n=1 Tax=Blepharisma stoltei TaxID=1481888 RepID=A0AAU9K282_9CILI|nr:unnamed protein product [Blepharisma stoltei]